MKYFQICILLIVIIFHACNFPKLNKASMDCEKLTVEKTPNTYIALFTKTNIAVDGVADECCWSRATWDTIQYPWLGEPYTDDDFSGRYKAAWNDSLLFLLIEITDDNLNDTHFDPTVSYWDDDCVEIFIDEDNSGGDHQYNHSAFAYHISPLMNVLDIGTNREPILLNKHVNGAILMDKNKYVWELAIKIFSKEFDEKSDEDKPVILTKDKTMGFSIAYCDSDTTPHRENFIGSVDKKAHYDNLGWINADSFGKMVLK